MERRYVCLCERSFLDVNRIAKIESSAIPGVGVMRIYFEQGTDIGGAIAQISASASSATRSMPPGITPPVILQFNASNVPVVQMTIHSDSLPEEKLFDYALNFIRVQLFTVPGLSIPAPYGGRSRQINVDVNPKNLAGERSFH